MKKTTLKKHLEKAFPGIPIFLSDYGLAVSAEDGYNLKNGLPIADYYDLPYYDPEEIFHQWGVNILLVNWLKKRGFSFEWINPGCISIHEI